jgi:hypothetical protein
MKKSFHLKGAQLLFPLYHSTAKMLQIETQSIAA